MTFTIKFLLCATFAASFSTYLFDLSPVVQLAPIALFVLAGGLALIVWRATTNRKPLLTSEVAGILVVVPLLTAMPSFLAEVDPVLSSQYWVLITIVLWSSRVLYVVLGIEIILTLFFYAGLVSLLLTIAFGMDALLAAATAFERISLQSFHYNLLGFAFAGFFAAALAIALKGDHRRLAALFLVVGGMVIFLTSSRGSLVAVFAGLAFLGALAILARRRQIQWLRVLALLVSTTALACLIALTAGPSEFFATTWEYFDNALDITSPYRGLESGLSGRTENWALTFQLLERGTWLWGEGYRAGNSLDLFIDNGYLVAWYELGIIPAALITFRYVQVLFHALKRHFESSSHGSWAWAGLCVVLIVFLANNIVARYLFGIGNPFSLLGLLILVINAAHPEQSASSVSVRAAASSQ